MNTHYRVGSLVANERGSFYWSYESKSHPYAILTKLRAGFASGSRNFSLYCEESHSKWPPYVTSASCVLQLRFCSEQT